MKTVQVMKMACNGVRLTCIHDIKAQKYKLYYHWWDGGDHKKQIADCDNMAEILVEIYNNSGIRSRLLQP